MSYRVKSVETSIIVGFRAEREEVGVLTGPLLDYNTYYQQAQAPETESIEDWLSPCNFKGKQERNFRTCFKPVGQWLLDHPTFRSWAIGGRPWYLRCHGEEGTGKVGSKRSDE